MTPQPPLADTVLRLLLDGMLEELAWSCEVFDAVAPTGETVLRSEFVTYCPYGGDVLRIRCQCDRWEAMEDVIGEVAFRLGVDSLSGVWVEPAVNEGSDAIRLFGTLRYRYARVLELEARRPFQPEPAGFRGTFEDLMTLVERHSPAHWRWSQIAHEGSSRELERRYETRIDRLQFTLQEFIDADTGRTRCQAQLEWAVADESPLPLLDSVEAAALVATVRRQALAARKAHG